MRDLWREYFAKDPSFNQFSVNFPATPGFGGGSKPVIYRKTEPNANGDMNPELFYFLHNKIAFFGLNQVTGVAYIDDSGINEEWITSRLSLDTNCEIESIIILAQRMPDQSVFDSIDLYFDGCGGTIPLLTITGDIHPPQYCSEYAPY